MVGIIIAVYEFQKKDYYKSDKKSVVFPTKGKKI